MNTQEQLVLQHRRQNLYLILSLFFLANTILAETIGPKIFSFDKMWDWVASADFIRAYLDGGMNLSAGVILWPVVFITTDIINHYFGRKGVRKITFATFFLLIFVFLAFWMSASLPPADFWISANQNDPDGNHLNINHAYSLLYTQGMNIIVGSLTAFVLSQLLDATVYYYIRKATKERFIWLRATGSTVVSQLIDSYLVITIAFYWLGNWSWAQILSVGTVQFIFKMLVAVLLIPVLYVVHHQIDRYLQKGLPEVDLVEK